jgi:hypothetical protein
MRNQRTVFQFVLTGVAVVLLFSLPALAAPRFEKDDMNDRGASERFDPPARGFVQTQLLQSGSVHIFKVVARNLEPGHDYEVLVTVQLASCGFEANCIDVVSGGTVTASDEGNINVRNIGLGNLDPGTYRLDIFVTHNHLTVPGAPGVGEFITSLISRDPLLACQPAPIVVVE